MPRTFNYIFNKINSLLSKNNQYNTENSNNNNNEIKQNYYRYNISLAFVQLYLESIQDLLDIESKDIRIREDPEKGVYLEGVQWFKCNTPEECEEVFHKGELNRNTESTKMNMHSSRSHAILILKIEKSMKIINPKNIKNIKSTDRLLTCSYLHLVDLAGSERVRKTGATNMRLEEAKKINLSLLCLGNVISSLTNPNTSHISYRDSKLTRLLKESLGGNAKTSLIVTVSPSTYNQDETMSSLLFALRAMKVQNRPVINKTVDYQALCIKLQDDLDKLNDDYAKLKLEYDKVVAELEKYKKSEEYFELQKKMGVTDISLNLDSTRDNNKLSSGDLANYNSSNSTGSNANTIESSSQKNNSINSINKINVVKLNPNNEYNSKIMEKKSQLISNDLVKENNKEIEKYKDQMKKMKKFYEKLMKNKKDEYENILRKVDDIIYKKENEIDKLNLQIKDLTTKLQKQKEDLDDMSKEKEDLQNSVSTLSSQVEEQKILLKNDKTEKQYKALIEILNDNIAALEKKIMKLEDTSIFTETSKEKIINSLDYKINEFQSQINNLTQQKNNSLIKKSQNELKINLISNEKNIENITDENINEEIRNLQKENYRLKIDEESITKKVEIIESQMKSTKKLNKNIKTLLDKYDKKNKVELITSLAKKEIDNIILNDCIKSYDNILINSIQLQHEDKFNLYKVENDLNNLINKSSLLLNNYLNYINKIDDINKELDAVVNDPDDNFDKLNQMRENIQILLEESDDINNITKNKELYNHNSNINNISYDKCPAYLENIITNMSENFLILIETYNLTNSNICHLISLMEESTCYKKKFVTNLSSFVQESVKDDFVKQNLLYKLTELLKSKMNEKDYNDKIEEIIKELFDKMSQNLKEKDKENKLLNQSVNLYMKQIDENIKKNNISSKQISSRNSYNEINNLKLKLKKKKKTLSNTKSNIDKMSTSFNKVNELIKSTNFSNNKIDTNKITNALAECQNFVKSMSKGLNVEINSNKNNKSINEILKKSLQKENLVEIKNLNDKKLPQKIFRQYFNNLSKFSKSIVNYGINDDDSDI